MVKLLFIILMFFCDTLHAGGGYDTNHPDVKWNTTNTKHFAFHWPESKRPKTDPHYFTTEFTVRK